MGGTMDSALELLKLFGGHKVSLQERDSCTQASTKDTVKLQQIMRWGQNAVSNKFLPSCEQ